MQRRGTGGATGRVTGRATEGLHDIAPGLDALPAVEIARHLQLAQADALASISQALPDISAGAQLMAATLRDGGALVYAAAGSSGLMAAADAMELPGTFGLAPQRIRILMSGGLPTSAEMPGRSEDDVAEAEAAAEIIVPHDLVIAVSASGSTPYTLTVARAARQRNARTICLANNRDAPLFDHATLAICLPTPPEVVAGSTRLGAGTAQKVALNMMSTLMGIALGHVHDGMMVNLRADNDKLRQRAVGMVSRIARVPEDSARKHLEAASGAVKPAVLLAAGADSPTRAQAILTDTNGDLRAALARL